MIRRRKGVEIPVVNVHRIRTRAKFERNDLFRRILKRDATPAEIAVRRYLRIIGIKRVMFQKGFFKPWHIIADFYFPGRKLILEIDGGYHNKQKAKDARRDAEFLRVRGIRTVRVTNEQVFSGEFKMILAREGINDLSVSERFTTKWIA